MKSLISVRQLVFIFSFMSTIMLLPTKGHTAPVLFQLEDVTNPMVLTGMFSVDDADPNYGAGFQALVDWAFFDMEGVPGIHTPVDNVTIAMALIDIMNPNSSVLSFMSIDTAIPPIIPSNNILMLNSDNSWSSGIMGGDYIVYLINIDEPPVFALFGLLLAYLVVFYRKRCRRQQ
ncbi:hypothetical protein [Spartinivicinus ruber]|uniref:hypothetical protein n=1 Tax=Spartinivicinus ruber TaxID=2683272 RepID=UPI0013D88C6F|nr:hypothetical protein [Spartinivicinus ruber]